ncbi:hypothetical protein VNO77_18997 [Canavalia gladiata]|uniref:Uncharacterized protein n=1 Tax=Canavalia gladiata TaxID=3824 RepID=A0AAN9QI52_CANGL
MDRRRPRGRIAGSCAFIYRERPPSVSVAKFRQESSALGVFLRQRVNTHFMRGHASIGRRFPATYQGRPHILCFSLGSTNGENLRE